MKRYWLGLSIRELSNQYGIPESNIKTQLYRTRELLKNILKRKEFTMNELIMRALSYVDDRWITEAMSDYETVKMKHFFKRTQKNISVLPYVLPLLPLFCPFLLFGL